MPKLLTLGVCRQAIVNRDDGSVSLISLISNITIQRQPDQDIPPDANTFFDWGAATVWVRLGEDEGKTFEQRTTLVSPDESTTELGITVFNMEAKQITNVLKAQGFPIGQIGTMTFRVELRETAKDQEWQTIAEYPLEVVHQIQEEATVVAD